MVPLCGRLFRMKTDLYIKSLLTLAVALLAVIAFRSTAGTASIVQPPPAE